MSEPFERALRAAARRGRADGVCPDAALLAAYVDRGVAAEERRRIEAHAADCGACQQHLALLGAVGLERGVPDPARSWLGRWGWLVPAATAVLVVAVWVRLPERAQNAPSAPASATQATPPVGAEHGAAGLTRPSGEGDPARHAAPRVAAEVSQDEPAAQASGAGNPVQLAPLARRDAARQKSVSAPPSGAPAAPPAVPTLEAPSETAQAQTSSGALSNAAPPAAVPPPGMADAMQEVVRAEASARQREGQQRMSAVAPAPSIVSASPTEAYRFVGNRVELSRDGGITWRRVLTDTQSMFTAAACASGGPCWFGTADGRILRRVPDGFSRSVLPVRARVVAIAPAAPHAAVATLEGGQRFNTADGGQTWAPIP